MTTKQELKDRLASRTAEAINLRREVNGLNRLLMDAQSAECRAITERDELRAQLAARQADEPGPRPFRVGDRVRVAEGATFQGADDGRPFNSLASGTEGVVLEVHEDGDLWIERQGYASPEFCTLIEADEPTAAPEPELNTPAPSPRVRVTYDDGQQRTFDADEIEVMEAAPVYALLKDGAVVACVPVAGVRSVEVVR